MNTPEALITSTSTTPRGTSEYHPIVSTLSSSASAKATQDSVLQYSPVPSYFQISVTMPISPSLDTTFLLSSTNPLTSTLKPAGKARRFPANRLTISSSSGNTPDGRETENHLAKLVVVTLAAGVLTLSSVNVDSAFAAKSAGRVGGQAFKSAAPRASAPRTNNSRTNIYVNPPVAPPLIGGYGYGVPYYGGYGWSPFSFFAPGPGVAVGVGGGFEFFFLFILLGAVSAVFRRFFSSRDEDLDDF